jgi:ABC-type polysaccharide/polyol phosphate export permease
MAPVPRPLLVFGPILGSITRCLVPVTVVLVAGLAIGADLPGGALGVLCLYVAAVGFCAIAALWGIFLAVVFRTQQAGPLMQQGVFLMVFLSTAYTPQSLLRGWLEGTARYNPVTHVLELGRQATVEGIPVTWANTWPGLVALIGLGLGFGALAMAGLRRMDR